MKEMFYLTTHFIELYGVRHMVKDHSESERGNPLPPHGLLFSINSKGSFICTIPVFVTPIVPNESTFLKHIQIQRKHLTDGPADTLPTTRGVLTHVQNVVLNTSDLLLRQIQLVLAKISKRIVKTHQYSL